MIKISTFYFCNGATTDSAAGLLETLQHVDEEVFRYHCNKEKNDFFTWLNTVKLNTIERRDLIISLLNENHEPVVTYKVKNAWPVKVQPADLKSDANEVAVESIELAHEGLVIENG